MSSDLQLLAQADDPTFWLPAQRSSYAPEVDFAFYLIYYVCVFFFLLIVALMTVFVIRYRRRPGFEPKPAPSHSTGLELLWTGIPLAIVVVIFYFGFTGFMNMRIVPREGVDINVTARQWSWSFEYSNGVRSETLHVPVDTPVKLRLNSVDVIHSFYVPEFRTKMDLVPGRYNKAWFRATKPGTYPIMCAEYCGESHYNMLSECVVQSQAEYAQWLDDAKRDQDNLPPVERGRRLVTQSAGCHQCHTIDGTPLKGPSFKGIWGGTHEFTDGSTALVDENYIRESILEPNAKIRAGYPAIMSPYKGQLSDDEISAIIEFIKTLK